MNKDLASDNKLPTPLLTELELMDFANRVVSKYVYYGTIPEREKDDVKMTIVKRFWEDQDSIASRFSGQAKRSTYCIAVLNRMCCEVIRKDLMHWKIKSEEFIREEHSSILSTSEHLIISDEARMLDKILRLFHTEKSKVLVYLACFFSLKPKKEHIKEYSANCHHEDIFQLLDAKNIQNKSHLFDNLAKVMNSCEHKSVKPDAVRMWLNKTMDKIIDQLNSPFQRANYDRDSLRTLFEHYYLSNGS
jgi:hypothetical protein